MKSLLIEDCCGDDSEIDWNKSQILEFKEYKMYVITTTHHDDKRFKGTVIYTEKLDKIGDVVAFKKESFKSTKYPITIKFEN